MNTCINFWLNSNSARSFKKETSKKIKKLALKHRYRTFDTDNEKVDVLKSLYCRRLADAEIKTAQAVEIFRTLTAAKIEAFFQTKRNIVEFSFRNFRAEQRLSYKVFCSLIGIEGIDNLVSDTANLLSIILHSRFGVNPGYQALEINSTDILNLRRTYSIVTSWQDLKLSTAELSQKMTDLSSMAWGKGIERNMKSDLLGNILKKIDVNLMIMTSVGINPREEKNQLANELTIRILGLMDNLKIRITQEINEKAAEVIYVTHDKIFTIPVEKEIASVEKLSAARFYRNQRA